MYKITLPLIAVLALAACDSDDAVRLGPKVEIDAGNSTARGLKVISNLQCPADMGTLTRQGSASADGSTCTYAGPRGAEVQLHLVNLNGQEASVALERFQTELEATSSRKGGTVTIANDESETTSRSDRTSIRLPGMSVDTDGDKADVRMPGMVIESDGEKANIRIGGMVIRTDGKSKTTDGENTIIINDESSADASSSSQSRKAVRASMLRTVARPAPGEWRVVGYEARGPGGGPIVVATFRTRDRDADDILSSVHDLLDINVGD